DNCRFRRSAPFTESSTLLGRPIVAAPVDSCDAAPATAGMVQHRLGGFEPDAQARDFEDGTWRRGRSGSMCAASKRECESNTGLGKARSIDSPKPYADLGRFPAAGFHLHVARMSRGPAGCQREPLKMNGNQSQHDTT